MNSIAALLQKIAFPPDTVAVNAIDQFDLLRAGRSPSPKLNSIAARLPKMSFSACVALQDARGCRVQQRCRPLSMSGEVTLQPQTLDHLEDNIRRVIADIRPQMLEKVIENWTSRLDYIRASRGSPMPEIIFKM
ncbi:hypothetical protein TNCV_1807031 [Trichonephila clavipes]|nr:hypothetical protein TNCV_1807031 [Trichonephila clavipes]